MTEIMNEVNANVECDARLRIDKAIKDTDDVICENIQRLSKEDRGFLSQNILSQLRNFVEYIAIKIYSNGSDVNPNDYHTNELALAEIKSRGDLRFLHKFHDMLQKSVSHYTVDREGSERLMLKYYEHLLKVKTYLHKTYGMEVLQNINQFPLKQDKELAEYYGKIAERINKPSSHSSRMRYDERYYIQKIKPFLVDHEIYYEVTFTAANNFASKFDRIIAFTNIEIPENYAIKFSIHNDFIQILGKKMNVLIIESYEVSIRPCEWGNLSAIVGPRISCDTNNVEYRELMRFLSSSKMSLTELVSTKESYYKQIKEKLTSKARVIRLFLVLDRCRDVIIKEKPGANVLRYLLYKMNNRVIKWQIGRDICGRLSNLLLDYGCIPFDDMPFCSALRQHNPRIYDLLDSIPDKNREHEFLARLLKNNTEVEGKLFTPLSEIEGFKEISKLVERYNDTVYFKHGRRKIKELKKHLYISGYVTDSTDIIKCLQKLASSGVEQYALSVDSWLEEGAYIVDDEEKKEALRTMFASSKVALIYGSAGTGKSTLIKHIANFWSEQDKLFLANTHPAVENMRRKVSAVRSEYSTIAKFLSNKTTKISYDILFIDECSTVSNEDMKAVLEKADFELLVLVGDIFQIESIYFGNWFSIAKMFVPSDCVFELKHPYRTTNEELLTIWDRVRQLDDAILEPLVKGKYVSRLNDSIFRRSDRDEIILCLNYDGLYGINNINRFLQNNNPNEDVLWGLNHYKIGDPILFNESNVFSPLIHNNSKGRIVGIRPEEQKIWFDVELEEAINGFKALGYAFKLTGQSENGNSIITFSVNKYKSTDEDEDDNDSSVVPFQVAYAISIHKAQGLEYDSVKVIITNEVEERITHNIFYTAITRAKKQLKIFWEPETEKAVLESFKLKDVRKDANLLALLSDIKMYRNCKNY